MFMTFSTKENCFTLISCGQGSHRRPGGRTKGRLVFIWHRFAPAAIPFLDGTYLRPACGGTVDRQPWLPIRSCVYVSGGH